MSPSSIEPARPLATRRPLRRLSIELVLVVIAKIAFLTLIWWIVAAHYPRPDTRPAAIAHLLAPSSPPSPSQVPHP